MVEMPSIPRGSLIVGHNLMYDLLWLKTLKGVNQWDYEVFDTLIGLHLLDENYPDRTLRHQYLKLTGETYEKPGEEAAKAGDININLLRRDARTDVNATQRLYRKVVEGIKKEGLGKVVWLDNQVLKVLVDISHRGFSIDIETLDRERGELLEELRQLESLIPCNPRSPKQVAAWLGVIGSTNEVVLANLRGERPRLLLRHRELSKREGTYYGGLRKRIYDDGKLHAWFNVAPSTLGSSTVTGRLSSSGPNLQNQPMEVKHLFIPTPPLELIFRADAEQLELRIIAEVTRDQTLLNYILEGRDLHDETGRYGCKLAGRMYGGKDDRFIGKTTNFGWFYGAGAYKLGQLWGVSHKSGSKLYNFLTQKFPGVQKWIEDTEVQLRERGYVQSIFGRKRRFGITSDFKTPQGGHILRQALNSPIQGGAGDLVKFIMLVIHKNLLTRGLRSGIINQVHDEIVIETCEGELEEVKSIVQEAFVNPPLREYFGIELAIPLKVTVGVGHNWKEASL